MVDFERLREEILHCRIPTLTNYQFLEAIGNALKATENKQVGDDENSG